MSSTWRHRRLGRSLWVDRLSSVQTSSHWWTANFSHIFVLSTKSTVAKAAKHLKPNVGDLFLVCDLHVSLVGLCVLDYKSLCAAVTIFVHPLVDPNSYFYILTIVTSRSRSNRAESVCQLCTQTDNFRPGYVSGSASWADNAFNFL